MSFFPMIEYYAELAKLQSLREQVPKTALNFWYQQQVWSDHKITIIQYFTGRTTEFTGSYTQLWFITEKGYRSKISQRRCMEMHAKLSSYTWCILLQHWYVTKHGEYCPREKLTQDSVSSVFMRLHYIWMIDCLHD